MDNEHRTTGPPDFAGYLQSVVQLEALESMTQSLDCDLANSRRVMVDMKTIFDAIPSAQGNCKNTKNLGYEDISKFLDADVPNFLLPDMAENVINIDLDLIIATMKSYAEELKKKVVHTEAINTPKEINSLDLEEYATSLDQLNKRLSNIKHNTTIVHKNKYPDLEIKLTQLYQDVNMFSQMVRSKTTLSESNKNIKDEQQDNSALYYVNIINKLLSDINEVAYLMKNKK